MSNQKSDQSDDPDSIRDPFTLIEKGNTLEASNDHWAAAYYFLRTSIILEEQSKEKTKQFQHQPANANNKIRKVAALYQDQSTEYLHKARNVLINALTKERDQDVKVASEKPTRVQAVSLLLGECSETADLNMKTDDVFEPLMQSLDDVQVKRRRALFHKLFISWDDVEHDETVSNDLGRFPMQKSEEEEKEMQLLSLEERLSMLETTLPPSVQKPKSDAQRMHDLQKSLSGLGVSVPSASDNSKNAMYQDINDIPEEDQVDEIMNMAKDEVMLNGGVNSETNDVMELLKKSSIRIDLNPENYDEDDFDSVGSPATSNSDEDNANDPEMEFWKNLDVGEEEEEDEPKTKLEEMKRLVSNAQQMLLQASICLEDMEERGYDFEEHNVETLTDNEADDLKTDQKGENDVGINNNPELPSSLGEEGTGSSSGKEELVDTGGDEGPASFSDDVDKQNVDNDDDTMEQETNGNERSPSASISSAAEKTEDKEKVEVIKSKTDTASMGKKGLEDARDAIDKLISMWKPKKSVL